MSSSYHLSEGVHSLQHSSRPAMSSPLPYVVLLSGTHVTGKESLAVALSQALSCPWLRAEMGHTAASFGARSQAKKGYSYASVFGHIFLSKLRRLGFLSEDGNESDGEAETETPRIRKLRAPLGKSAIRADQGEAEVVSKCSALITLFATRKPARDAIREMLSTHGVKVIFIILQITPATLAGRTLGAEEPELARRIMGEKVADIEEPLEEETDVVLVDTNPAAQRDVDAFFTEIMDGIGRQVSGMRE